MDQDQVKAAAAQALKEAIAHVGGAQALANEITRRTGKRISRAAVAQWKVTPPKRVAIVQQITGIPGQRLCPGLYSAQPLEQVA